ncbi:DUF2306 domain-containing protein [Pseudoalteromonas luteoviolacea]|uniref:DUF2306 domain-containing protein n=1 Tax=Pseudoalteromonas luteoviolacea TaxID=43657 RepID=UPI001F301FD7|nr:DUF2306 domain-containing protein [Pseudoalteromonas luteoviolacea]MCF6438831.1 DUF2306 domain-containing protein [Pseudoalteromonas luteoviolacea]
MDISLPILIHLFAVTPAIGLGFLNLAMKKGTSLHKLFGRVWVALMIIASLISFLIQPTGSLTWLHLFAILVIVSVSIGTYAIYKQNQKLHLHCMSGAYIGTVISAIVAASVPGLLLHQLLF